MTAIMDLTVKERCKQVVTSIDKTLIFIYFHPTKQQKCTAMRMLMEWIFSTYAPRICNM